MHRFNPYDCLLASFHLCPIQQPHKVLFSPILWVGSIGPHKFWVQLWQPTADLCHLAPLRCALHPSVTVERLLGTLSSLHRAGKWNSISFAVKRSNHLLKPSIPHHQQLWGSFTYSQLRGLTVVSDGGDLHFHAMFVHGVGYTGQPLEVFWPVLAGKMARDDGNEEDGRKCPLGARDRQDCFF